MRIKPHINIGPDTMLRWHLIPKNEIFNIFLHHWLRSDDDRACHDHPWWSISIMLKGRIGEVVRDPCGTEFLNTISRWIPKLRSDTYAHRIVLITPTAWTLFITFKKTRRWGFYCPKGWIHWEDFCKSRDNSSEVGRGCD